MMCFINKDKDDSVSSKSLIIREGFVYKIVEFIEYISKVVFRKRKK